MPIRLSADEVLTIAIKIEENGAAFYYAAAERFRAEGFAERLKELYEWEKQHAETFASIKAMLAGGEKEATSFDPDNQALMYLEALADRSVFDRDEDPLAVLGAGATLKDVLKEALNREKESVVFYVGLREVVPEGLGKDKVNAILKEEMSHVSLLTQELAKLQ